MGVSGGDAVLKNREQGFIKEVHILQTKPTSWYFGNLSQFMIYIAVKRPICLKASSLSPLFDSVPLSCLLVKHLTLKTLREQFTFIKVSSPGKQPAHSRNLA